MENFIYEYPTKVLLGRGAARAWLAEELKPYGNKIMLAYGGGSIKNSGIYDEIKDILKSGGKEIVEFSGIMPNPTYKRVQEGARTARENNVDFIEECGLPMHLSELDMNTELDDAIIRSIADSTNIIKTGYGVLTREEIYDILKECM